MINIRYFVVILLMLCSGFARADYREWYYGEKTFLSPDEGCRFIAPQSNITYLRYDLTNNNESAYCFGMHPTIGEMRYVTLNSRMKAGDGPPPINPCSDKNPMIRQYVYKKPPYFSPDHFLGCIVEPIEMLRCGKNQDGSLYCFWLIKRTGQIYSGDPVNLPGDGAGANDSVPQPDPSVPSVPSPPIAPPKPATPDICKSCVPCPKGTVQAGIGPDGVPMCIGTGTDNIHPPNDPSVTTKPPVTENTNDGGTKTTQQTVQMNSDGSTTTTTVTTIRAADGSTTVNREVSVSNNAGGRPGQTDPSSQEDKGGLCKQNPNLSICRESSVSGTCGEITCIGDAIQCGTLRAAAAMQCKQQADEDALKAMSVTSVGQAIMNGNDPKGEEISEMVKGTEVDMSKASLDDSGFLGGGSCLANRSIPVLGQSVTMDFTTVCSNIQPLRFAVMACAFIIAYLLVARSVLQS